jgi:hypothetical protein
MRSSRHIAKRGSVLKPRIPVVAYSLRAREFSSIWPTICREQDLASHRRGCGLRPRGYDRSVRRGGIVAAAYKA